MKAVKWILIALAVIVVIVLTLPAGGFSVCEHTYTTTTCGVKQCTKCENVIDPNRHNWKRIGCSQMYCTVCGKTSAASHDYEYIDCTNKRVCRVCNKVAYSHYARHPDTNRVDYVDCRYEVRCTKCEMILHQGISHNWSEHERCQDAHCVDCGINASKAITHRLYHVSNMFDLPTFCQDCGVWYFPPLNFGNTCVYLGILFTIAAFIFIYFNRQRIRVREGRFFCTLTPDSQLRVKGTEEEFS